MKLRQIATVCLVIGFATVLDGARLQVFHDEVTHSEADSKCRSLGGTLATPTTPTLQQEMLRMIDQSGGPIGYGYWIGLTAPVTGGKNFVWSNGQPLVGWSNWGAGQPNNFQGMLQDCVVMKMLAGQRDRDGWNDNSCDERRNFVCQFPDGRDQPSCWSDRASCLQQFRALLNDQDYFWFGNKFFTQCPAALPITSANQACINPSNSTTLLGRLMEGYSAADILSVSTSVNLAEVSFSGESRAHFSCGHQFPAMEKPVEPLRVEPLQTVRWSQAQVDTTPTVRWPAVAGVDKYTVVVLDMGNLFLHGIFINARQQMTDGQMVYRYSGPKGSTPRDNAYLWVVLPQRMGDLDFRTVQGVYYGLINPSSPTFNFVQFTAALGFGLGDLQQSSMTVMNIEGDAYGAEYLKQFADNNCPLITSRNPFLYRASTWAQLPVSWSHPASLTSSDTRDVSVPYLTSLTTELEVTFNVEDIEFESCCSHMTYIRAQLTPDPFKSPKENPERPVQLRNAPRVKMSPVGQSTFTFGAPKHTLMLVDFGHDFQDFTASPPSDPTFIIHWLVSNISNFNVNNGNELIPYFGSNPFAKDSPRMYTFLLLEQTQDFSASQLRTFVTGNCASYPQRCFYRVGEMMSQWGLTEIKAVTWYFAQQDAFARQRIYRTWSVKDKTEVCQGVKGYNWACCWWAWWNKY